MFLYPFEFYGFVSVGILESIFIFRLMLLVSLVHFPRQMSTLALTKNRSHGSHGGEEGNTLTDMTTTLPNSNERTKTKLNLVTSHPANCYNAFNKQLRWNRFELSELR